MPCQRSTFKRSHYKMSDHTEYLVERTHFLYESLAGCKHIFVTARKCTQLQVLKHTQAFGSHLLHIFSFGICSVVCSIVCSWKVGYQQVKH